ncbi:NAD(P)H:quinone oxidoreductase, type IV [Moraxella caviae]|uniref:NAD(P)H:quinone oxidoreductase, type IV n=1 Tax=Moraxella caviae TaxID=34060 RepID=A0A1S9ZY06_9GAMM|nr:NAD(P)H:quinone oxidoreductase [Moraxella caviae]OOR88297.1 NAD(P)H:quinone oxidoreductase, type IV [Moraxella caviae]STZ13905.1 Trp repressor-binding protein [Moraxella caviae]
MNTAQTAHVASQPYVLVLYDSTHNTTKELTYLIAQGVQDADFAVKIRRVPKVSSNTEQSEPVIPDEGDLYATLDDLANCAALALGSPTHFGNMSASLKYFLDNSVGVWLSGALQGKPACVFTSTGSMHGGNEATLLSMMIPLLHHGMVLVGLPYANAELSRTVRGGTPYGASAVVGARHELVMTADEKSLAIAQGKRLADVAKRLLD